VTFVRKRPLGKKDFIPSTKRRAGQDRDEQFLDTLQCCENEASSRRPESVGRDREEFASMALKVKGQQCENRLREPSPASRC